MFYEKSANSVHNSKQSHGCFALSQLLGFDFQQKCFKPISHLSHRIFKIWVVKGQYLIKLIITALLTTFLSEAGLLFFFFFNCKHLAVKNPMTASTIWCHCPDSHSGICCFTHYCFFFF